MESIIKFVQSSITFLTESPEKSYSSIEALFPSLVRGASGLVMPTSVAIVGGILGFILVLLIIRILFYVVSGILIKAVLPRRHKKK